MHSQRAGDPAPPVTGLSGARGAPKRYVFCLNSTWEIDISCPLAALADG